jgi:GH15 family glucan-1,4-alpha-glucosidase
MTRPIEDYALISNCQTAALVSSDGSIDWLCLPRYDSASAFGALLGTEEHGNWSLRPADAAASATRSYDGDTLTLVTTWTTGTGVVEVRDTRPVGQRGRVDVVRIVRGVSGSVEMRHELRIRFGYASALPWVRKVDEDDERSLLAIAGPDAVIVRGPLLTAHDHAHTATETVTAGTSSTAVLTWFPSHRNTPAPLDVEAAIGQDRAWWLDWASVHRHVDGLYPEAVMRSLLTLRALTDSGTGGIVAAATTSLPEQFGGERNWDYRYVWLRDASLTLQALLEHGNLAEAQLWRQWLLRAVAGDPADVQIMYGLAGERYLPEHVITSLPGYDGAAPVRVGNDAVSQYQADVIGEVMVGLAAARDAGLTETAESWPLQRALVGFIEENWTRPDQGLWEIRGPARHFTHSRVMIWAALDRAVRAVHEHGLPGPVARWEKLRDTVRAEIESKGVSPDGAFVQYYGGTETDAALLLLPEVGFCSHSDPRMLATVTAIEKELMRDGLLQRYRTEKGVDGLPPGENPFLACSFWLVRQYASTDRLDEARALMDRLLALRSDVGLLAEEVEVSSGHHAGNYPQAYSHLALVHAANAIGAAGRADPGGVGGAQ